jgi:uncharacterized membrane protein (UPF0127 family)
MSRFCRDCLSLSLLVACAACNRTEEPRSSPVVQLPPASGAHEQSRAAAEAPPTASTTPSRCVTPMPDEAPPVAHPASQCPPDVEERPVLPRGAVTFLDAAGDPRVEVELARTPHHKQRGLMFRTELARDGGMLFSWNDEEVRSFWMRNTCIPLDMLFIAADGTIAGVLEQVPVLNTASRSVPCPAMHVLELNAGWARAHGVRPGQKVRIEG